MAQKSFILEFDSASLPAHKVLEAVDSVYNYLANGFTDDFNPLLNINSNAYLISVDSGPDWFKFRVHHGWDSPTNKYKQLNLPNP